MLTVLLSLALQDLVVPELRASNLEAWREHIRPVAAEVAFEEIDWIDDFARGIRASDEQQKPLLFWAMNGHPLGCT
jgi:hypothetical protein